MDPGREQEWVRRARQGDREAFASLVDLYWERLRRWSCILTGHADAAEDVTQEAFVRAWAALPRLTEESRFRVWLFRIAKNCWLDARRGPRGQTPRALSASLADKQPEPIETLVEDEGRQLLRAALARLPELYREAYVLWTQESIPYIEIAQVLGISEEAARWRVCKARQRLLSELKTYLDCPSP